MSVIGSVRRAVVTTRLAVSVLTSAVVRTRSANTTRPSVTRRISCRRRAHCRRGRDVALSRSALPPRSAATTVSTGFHFVCTGLTPWLYDWSVSSEHVGFLVLVFFISLFCCGSVRQIKLAMGARKSTSLNLNFSRFHGVRNCVISNLFRQQRA